MVIRCSKCRKRLTFDIPAHLFVQEPAWVECVDCMAVDGDVVEDSDID